MEKLMVRNFFHLREIEFNLSRINILIDSEDQGKSIVIKLVYFFKKFLLEYHHSILQQHNQREFDQQIIDIFNEIFSEYSGNMQNFEIVYYLNTNYIKLYNSPTENKYQLFLEYSEYLVNLRVLLLEEYNKNFSNNISSSLFLEKMMDIQRHETLSRYLFPGEEKITTIDFLTFIPANRSFLNENLSRNYFCKQFAVEYELMQKSYQDRIFFQEEHKKIVDELVNKIILGNYVYENGQEWIYIDNNHKVQLSDLSHEQKELLPLILTLVLLPFDNWCNRIFFIEKPEAHLLAETQNYLVNLISLIFNISGNKNKFFITTDSPYILTAFNELIQALYTLKMLIEKNKNEELIDKLTSIIPTNRMLNINDINACIIRDGVLESLINQENQLINPNIFDEVSKEFNKI